MAVTNGYCTVADLRAYLKRPASEVTGEDQLADAINSASRAIDDHCGRVFYDSGSASARKFAATDAVMLWVDDFSTTTGLVIKTDVDGDGTFETTWTSADYELSPPSGVKDGVSGWPYTAITAVGSYTFPMAVIGSASRRYRVEVTARWGWAAVPEPVRQACLQVAAEEYRRADAPFGIAQTVDFGPIRMSADAVRAVRAKLEHYRTGSRTF